MLWLFDLDGTLIDSAPGIFGGIEHALAVEGVPIPPREQLRGWVGPPLWHSFAEVFGDDPPRIRRAIERYRERFLDVGWREHEVFDGIEDTLDVLQARGARCAVVTSKPQAQAERILGNQPLGERFEGIYAPDPDDHDHTKAELIARALDACAIAPADAVMVGDRRYDMEGACANGVRGLGVLWGFGDADELLAAGAAALAGAPRELPGLAETAHT
jgi:phosphoglycolate phosphatase